MKAVDILKIDFKITELVDKLKNPKFIEVLYDLKNHITTNDIENEMFKNILSEVSDLSKIVSEIDDESISETKKILLFIEDYSILAIKIKESRLSEHKLYSYEELKKEYFENKK